MVMPGRPTHWSVTAALAMLIWQIAVAAVPPLALCCAPHEAFAEVVICTCDHMEDGACPMKHGADEPERPVDADAPRWCAGCGDPLQALATLMQYAGAPPEDPWRTPRIGPADSTPPSLASFVHALLSRTLAPPPKA